MTNILSNLTTAYGSFISGIANRLATLPNQSFFLPAVTLLSAIAGILVSYCVVNAFLRRF